MARQDCTEWALTINDLAMDIASEGKGVDLAVVTKAISILVGAEISRDMVIASINEVAERAPRDLTEGEKNILAIRNEARQDTELNRLIKEHDEAVARGETPVSPSRSKAAASDIIMRKRAIREEHRRNISRVEAKEAANNREVARLRKRQSQISREIETGEKPSRKAVTPRPVSKEVEAERGKREALKRELTALNKQKAAVRAEGKRTQAKAEASEREVVRLRERQVQLRNEIETGEKAPKQGAKKRAVTKEVQAERDIRDAIKKELVTANKARAAVKSQENIFQRITQRIAEKQRLLDRGGVPQPKPKSTREQSEKEKELRTIEKDLDKLIAQSEEVKIARMKKQMADLEDIMEKGDFAPKIKLEPTHLSKEFLRQEFELNNSRRRMRANIEALKPKTMFSRVLEGSGLARMLMTGFESSAVLRQGALLFFSGRFKILGTGLAQSFRGAFSEQRAFEIEKESNNRLLAPLYRRDGLAVTELDGSLTKGEEELQSRIGKKIPGLAQSSRAYVIFLNSVRMDLYDVGHHALGQKSGELTRAQGKTLAKAINVFTGRGTLGKLEKVANEMNIVFFAPRFVASRFQFVLGSPLLVLKEVAFQGAKLAGKPEWVGGSSQVRQLMIKEVARVLTGYALFYTMASLLLGGDDKDEPFDIEFDPRSTDFGKLRFGNTRLDPLGGLSQTIVFLARLRTGEIKSATTQNVIPLTGVSRFTGVDKEDVAARFLRSKLSPMAGLAATLGFQKDFKGDKPIFSETVLNLVTPMTGNDIYDALREQGFEKGTVLGMIAFFGMGLQTYGSSIDTKPDDVLEALLKKHTFRETKVVVNRQGRRVLQVLDEPHQGQEGRVAAIRKELRTRSPERRERLRLKAVKERKERRESLKLKVEKAQKERKAKLAAGAGR